MAKFLLFKQAFKLGEDIVGLFDFSDGTIPCVQVSADEVELCVMGLVMLLKWFMPHLVFR